MKNGLLQIKNYKIQGGMWQHFQKKKLWSKSSILSLVQNKGGMGEVQWAPKCKEGATCIWRFVLVNQWQTKGAEQPNQLRVCNSNYCWMERHFDQLGCLCIAFFQVLMQCKEVEGN